MSDRIMTGALAGAAARRRQAAPLRRESGTVKFFSRERMFGFIVSDQTGPDVFVHSAELRRARIDYLDAGDRVEFDWVPGDRPDRGPVARNVVLLPRARIAAEGR